MSPWRSASGAAPSWACRCCWPRSASWSWSTPPDPDRLHPAGPVGPAAVPAVVGVALLVIAVLLARDVLRGGHGESEVGEDVDLSHPSDWRTVLLLIAAFLANVVLIDRVGFPSRGRCCSGGCLCPGQPPLAPRPADRPGPVGRHLPDLLPRARHRPAGGRWRGSCRWRRCPTCSMASPPRLLPSTRWAALGDPRHRGRGATRHRPAMTSPAAAGHLRPRPDGRLHHVRRDLLRRHVRRLDHLDPAQHPGRKLLGGHRHRGQPHGQRGRAAQALATAAIGSFVAGLIGTMLLVLLAPYIVKVAVGIGAPTTSPSCCWPSSRSPPCRGRRGSAASPRCSSASPSA